MDLQVKADAAAQAFDVVVKDKFGNTVAGGVAVAVGDSSIATAALDGNVLTIAPAGQGKLGSTAVTVADAADSLTATVNVTVDAGAPVSIDIVVQPAVPAVDAAAAVAPAPAAAPSATGE